MNLLNFVLLQINETVSNTEALITSTPTEDKLSILELLLKGGWIVWPIIALSFVAVYIFIERYTTIKRASREEANFMAQIRDFVLNGNIDAAKSLCACTENPIARMTEKGINRACI